MRKSLIILTIFLLFIVKVCVRYESENYYDISLSEQIINEDKINRLYLLNESLSISLKEDISKDLILESFTVYFKEKKLGEVRINKYVSKMDYRLVETKDKEIRHYFDYSLTKDLMEILGEDFKNYPLILESSWDRMLQFDIVLENTRLKKKYKIVFKNISLFYIEKGFKFWMPSV